MRSQRENENILTSRHDRQYQEYLLKLREMEAQGLDTSQIKEVKQVTNHEGRDFNRCAEPAGIAKYMYVFQSMCFIFIFKGAVWW